MLISRRSDQIRTAPSLSFAGRLSLLWLFAILNILFRDIHELTMAGTVREILSGHLNGVAVTEELLVFGALVVELLLLAFLLTNLLPRRPARLLNLVVAPLAIVGTIAAGPSDPDDYFFAAIEIATFAAIFILAWRWPADPRS